MPKKKKILLICLASALALLLFIVAVLPVIVRNQAVKAIADETGRKVRIEKISINPFTLTVSVKGFAIEAREGGPFISIASLRASLSLASLYKRALIVSNVSVEAPSVSFTRLADNSYSFSDIIERQQAKPKKPKSEAHFSINNILLKNGSVDFDDQAVEDGRKHTIRNLDFAIPFISNIPYMVEKYTDPRISALVNGAPFNFSGKVKPLSKSMETSVHINLKELSLPEYVAYSPVKPPADLASGTLSIDSDITYRIHSDEKPQLQVKGSVRFEKIAVNLKSGAPLVRIPLCELKASLLDVLAGKFAFESILFDRTELFVSRDAKGQWMFSQLLKQQGKEVKDQVPVTESAASTTGRSKNKSPLVQIASFNFNNGLVHFSDAYPAGGFKGAVSEIDAAVKNFSTEERASAGFDLSMLFDDEATLTADGSFSLTPLTVTISSALSGMKLQRGWPYLSQILTAPVKGTIDISSEATYNKEDGLAVTEGKFLASGLSARYGDKDGFDLSRFEVNGSTYSQKDSSIGAAEIKLSKGNISLSRETDGSLSVLSLLKKQKSPPAASSKEGNLPTVSPAPSPASKKPSIPAAKGQKPSSEFSFRFKKIQVDKLTTTFTDKTFEEKPRFVLSNTSLSLSNLNGPRFTPAALRFSSTFNKDTPLKASGNITPVPFRYKGSVTIGRLPLRDFEAYFPANLNVFVLGGTADTSMSLDIALKNGKPSGTFKGSAGVRAFHVIDSIAEEDLLKWESLQLDDIQGNLEPFSLALREIALNGVYSRIIIRKDGTLNLQNLVQKEEKKAVAQTTEGTAVQPSEPPPATIAAAASPAPPAKKQIRVDAVTIQDGTIAFTDNHLPQRFNSTFYNLGGRISGLSSEDARFADVDLRGNLENHSPLQITGKINPLREDLFVDLKIAFQDIELSPATPYTGRFLGYTVEKGKLSLDLKYRIDKKQLDSENRIFIDQFTFGEKVESDKATTLPVKLGLALLKDRKGEIHLDVPVTGRTDDPKFSIWSLVFQVLQNLLIKAVTSPFALLSSMMGGGQDFSAIQFEQGRSTLTTVEEQKLGALAKALLDRPALKVELKGYVDREKDAEAYRNELFNRKLRNEKFLALSKAGTIKEGEKSESLQVQPDEYATYLKAVYKKEKFPKPRNVIGLVKDLPPDEMKKLIITNMVIGEPELQTLAKERVVAVSNHLVNKGTVPAERVFQKNDNIFKAPEKDTQSKSRVELNAIAQ
ncbi:MAG: DUF748 domain-containing protein [Geobacteraceae bacterium]|nr:DUF748 domain-containing protein [Geobacteraceae bacterium]